MGAWSGKWKLTVAISPPYSGLNVGSFTLRKVTGQTDRFKVHTSPKSKTAKWLGVEFKLEAGQAGPVLPWPLPSSPKTEHFDGAGSYIRDLVKDRWGQQGRIYEYLVGDVDVAGVATAIVLFKADKGLLNGKDYLVGFLKSEVIGQANPNGSVSGTRN